METQSKQIALSLINQKLGACNERTLYLHKKKGNKITHQDTNLPTMLQILKIPI
jgi:hypothetical protein